MSPSEANDEGLESLVVVEVATVSPSDANDEGLGAVGSEPTFITESTKIYHHLVVAVDKAHVNQTLPMF